jgi:GNAT superfamily N-acetyltransferase
MSIAFSRFEGDDRDDLIHVIDRVCESTPYMATACFQPTPSWMQALAAPDDARHLLLIARDNCQIVGWCRLFPEGYGASHQVELGIGLLAPYRQQGLGIELVTRALDWARQVGCGLVSLQVHPANAAARHVFEKCGFQYDVTANGQLTMTQRLFAEEQRE